MATTMEGELSDRSLYVLYASETGVTEDHAIELGRALERQRFSTTIIEMDELDLNMLSSIELAIFMTSTTGQGDMPANMRKLWKFLLRKKLPNDFLSSMRFTSFGFGDSTYPKYNWAVKKLHKRLLQLGASEIYPRGEGDERHDEGHDGTFIPWTTDFCKTILETFPLPAGIHPIPIHELLPSKYILEVAQGDPVDQTSYENIRAPREPGSFTSTLERNDRATAKTHFQDVRHLTFSFSEPLEHVPGDALSILPQNIPAAVDDFLSIINLDINPDLPLRVIPNPSLPKAPPPIPPFAEPLTLRSLITHHLDITAIPGRSFFAFIAAFSNDETHRERLIEFTDPQYLDELYDYTTRPRRSIMEVLQEFSSVKIPLSHLLEVIPRIRPRLFSIASSRLQYDEPKLDLLVAIVKYRTVIKKIRDGLCTRYLAGLPVGSTLNVCIAKGGLVTDRRDRHTPVIMVGPGTGVAPMRALIYERMLDTGGDKFSLKRGKNVLFFGCRGNETDYFFKDEWQKLKTEHNEEFLTVITAFSRDQKQKDYVQHRIKQNAQLVHHLLRNLLGIVYVCGSSGRMPQAIREALIEVIEEQGGLDRDGAEKYLLTMEKEGRYRQETW